MKLLVWHCSYLSYRDRRPSNRPAGVERFVAEAVEEKFTDTLVAFVCVEKDDTEDSAAGAIEEILKLSDQMMRRDIVLVPFAHLSSQLMTDSGRAKEILEIISTGLDRAGLNTALTSFGFHKDFELHFAAMGHPAAVAFREIGASPVKALGPLPSRQSGLTVDDTHAPEPPGV